MSSREELHRLIDSLPEGAVDAAHRTLSHLQVWPAAAPPPSRTPDLQEMRERMRQQMDKRRELMERNKHTMISAFGGTRYEPDFGTAYSSSSHWDGDTHVTQTVRLHQGHELVIIQHTRMEGAHLIYKHEITGPGDKHDEREINFEIS